MSAPGQRLVDYREAAVYLGVPIGTLRSMVSRKQVPHVRLTARIVRFDLSELDSLIATRRVAMRGEP
jgi:excisionase family DNA binding protein